LDRHPCPSKYWYAVHRIRISGNRLYHVFIVSQDPAITSLTILISPKTIQARSGVGNVTTFSAAGAAASAR
jgi:hypothetical protein